MQMLEILIQIMKHKINKVDIKEKEIWERPNQEREKI